MRPVCGPGPRDGNGSGTPAHSVAVVHPDRPRVDWAEFERFAIAEIVAAVAKWTSSNATRVPRRAALFDFHVRDMLILFPSVAIDDEPARHPDWCPEEWSWQHDPGRDADAWAGRVTASIGSGGGRWEGVVERYFAALVTASHEAARYLRAMEAVSPDFLIVVLNGDDEQIVRSVPPERLVQEFPAIAARRLENARLAALSPAARTDELMRAIAEPQSSPLIRADAIGLLMECGPAAVAAVAARICDVVPADGLDWCAVLDALSAIPDDVAAQLRDVVGTTGRPEAYRARVASSVGWLGRLGEIVDLMSDMSDEVVLSVLSRRYLADHLNGGLEYASLERVLASRPHLDHVLATQLSPSRMFAIGEGEVGVAMAGLSSRWVFVRRHAATVLLTVHV